MSLPCLGDSPHAECRGLTQHHAWPGWKKRGRGLVKNQRRKPRKRSKAGAQTITRPHSGRDGMGEGKVAHLGEDPPVAIHLHTRQPCFGFGAIKPLLPTSSCRLALLCGQTVRPEFARPRGRLVGLVLPELVVIPAPLCFHCSRDFSPGPAGSICFSLPYLPLAHQGGLEGRGQFSWAG